MLYLYVLLYHILLYLVISHCTALILFILLCLLTKLFTVVIVKGGQHGKRTKRPVDKKALGQKGRRTKRPGDVKACLFDTL